MGGWRTSAYGRASYEWMRQDRDEARDQAYQLRQLLQAVLPLVSPITKAINADLFRRIDAALAPSSLEETR